MNIQGFIKTSYDLMMSNSTQLSELACQVLISISQKNMLELFLSQLPSLYNDRIEYLRMIFEQFQLYMQVLENKTDDMRDHTLLQRFLELGIPNFFIAQCLIQIEGNLVYLKEAQL